MKIRWEIVVIALILTAILFDVFDKSTLVHSAGCTAYGCV
jgi:hypothetical protein